MRDFWKRFLSGRCYENSASAACGLPRYFADLLVEDALVVELKSAERLASQHTAQCLNYLRASGRTVCRLVNFQRPKVAWQRIVRGFADGNSGLE